MEALKNDELVVSRKKGKDTINYKQYLKDEDGQERSSKLYSVIEGIYTQQGTKEVQDIFGDGKAFTFPKPSKLIELLIRLNTVTGDTVMDSFAGSGTTGHAALRISSEANEERKFILIEIDANTAKNITAKRLRSVISSTKTDQGFRFCRLGQPLFDEHGRIAEHVTFVDLARHVFFAETGEPLHIKRKPRTPFLGSAHGTGVYLLYNGILKDKSPNGGNVLTRETLRLLPEWDGPKVVYGTACRLSEARLSQHNVTFRQIPYEIRVD